MRATWALLLLGGLLPSPARGADFLGKSRQEWTQELRSEDPRARRSAAFALGKLGASAALSVPALTERLTDANAEVRAMAARALGEIARASDFEAKLVWKHAGDLLHQVAAKASEEDQPRRGALYALGCCGSLARSAKPSMIRSLREDASAIVRQNAAWALGRLGSAACGEDGARTLAAALERDKESAEVLRITAEALGGLDPALSSIAVEPLFHVARNRSEEPVLSPTLTTLSQLVTPQHQKQAEQLHVLLTHRSSEIRLAATFVLSNAGVAHPKILEILIHELRHGERRHQELVVGALAGLGPSAAPVVPDLIRILRERNQPASTPDLRRNAAHTLGAIGPKAVEAVSVLGEVLDPKAKEPVEVRLQAAVALGKIGPPHLLKVKEVIYEVLKDPKSSPAVRADLVWALADVPDFKAVGALEPLLVALEARGEGTANVRYGAARLLAHRLRAEAPQRVIEVLVEILEDESYRIVEGSVAELRGGQEGASGSSKVNLRWGRDGRYLAAAALAYIGPKANQPAVISNLEALAKSDDARTRQVAGEALRVIRR